MKKLAELKKARYEILNAEKKPPKKLKVKEKINVQINDNHMDSEFK